MVGRAFQSSQMSRASVTRLLKVLSDSGYIVAGSSPRDGYSLGMKLFYMLNTVKDKLNRQELIQRWLDDPALDINGLIQCGVFDRSVPAITIIAKAESEGVPALAGAGYDVAPVAHRHALGKLILALASPAERERLMAVARPKKNKAHTIMSRKELDDELQKIGGRGVAFGDQEGCEGINRVAVSLFNAKGRISGSLCACWFASKFSEKDAEAKIQKREKVSSFIQEMS